MIPNSHPPCHKHPTSGVEQYALFFTDYIHYRVRSYESEVREVMVKFSKLFVHDYDHVKERNFNT